MNAINPHAIETLGVSKKWQHLAGRNINVLSGRVTLERDTGVFRCAEHGIRLVYNFIHDFSQCPECSASVISQMAEM